MITFVIFASGLKYVGVPTTALGWICGTVLAAGLIAFAVVSVRRRRDPEAQPAADEVIPDDRSLTS